VIAEQVCESDRPVLAIETIVLGYETARGQRTTLGGDALDVAAQLDLLLEDIRAIRRGSVACWRGRGRRRWGEAWGSGCGLTSCGLLVVGRRTRTGEFDRGRNRYLARERRSSEIGFALLNESRDLRMYW
jgi:hypothetical protein